jgi:hypothetical protein
MWFGLLTLATALIISVSAAYYSILGLTAIFAAAFWPIVILGSSLEVGKIVSTLWLHKYWDRAEAQYKVYLCTAVAILMLLTSMGVFGFLSKAHTDQSLVSGDVIAKISIYDEKIKTERDNIEASRKALQQMDNQVDARLSRGDSEQSAERAVQIRRNQAKERATLQKEIATAQNKISKLNEERAPIAAEVRKVEAEVGPIKYIAALIYGDNPEANVLEKSVRWVIILIVIVFDPLALTLLLAATKSIEWERGVNIMAKKRKEPEYEPDDGPLTDEQIKQIKEMAKADLPTGEVIVKETLFPESKEFFDRARKVARDIDSGTYQTPQQPVLDPSPAIKSNLADKIVTVWENLKRRLPIDSDTPEKIAERAWKAENPTKLLKKQRQLLREGKIDILPWNQPEFRDHISAKQIHTGFGREFPAAPAKGDMFLKTDRLPTILHKFNGSNWIQVDKDLSDSYAYNTAYIDHLIEKISTGEYDPELLSESERISIEQRLNQNTQS